jgi:hypothetical protein
LLGTFTNHPLSFYINSSEKARIDSSGRLLIGTSTTAAAATELLQVQGISGNTAAGGAISLRRASVGNTDQIGIIHFKNASEGASHASISAICDGTPSAGDFPGALLFSTTADGASSPTERMRIANNGIVSTFNSVGDSLNIYNANGAGTSNAFLYGLHSATNNVSGGTTSVIIYTNGNIVNTNGSYTTISDAKLKENIVDAGSQWNDFKAIRIRNWNFKTETGHETHRQIGPIAQELETVCPGLVFETPDRDEDGNETGEVTKGVNQSVLYMKAVKALQEAMERIEQLESSNADLLARVTALEVS